MSLAVKTNFLKPQAQEGSSHRHVPDPCLASDLELPELPCAGATPEVTAKLLLVYGSQDFPPGKPHLWDVKESCSQICDELRRGLYKTSRNNRSVWVSCSVVSNSLRPHELQHTRPPCSSPTPGVHSDSRPSSQCCHPAISSSVVPFSSCPQFLPASESFPMSQLFTRVAKVLEFQL